MTAAIGEPKAAFRFDQTSGRVTAEEAGSTGDELMATKVPAAPSSSAGPAAEKAPGASGQSVTSAASLPQASTSDSRAVAGIIGISTIDSADTSEQANSAEAATIGGQKPGQQSGTGPEENPKPSAPEVAHSPAPNSTATLLAPHAINVSPSHADSMSQETTASASPPPTALSAWQNYDGGAGRIVRSASLTNSADSAEMHVELRTTALGTLEVHTVVREGSVGAEIRVQGQEAHTLLAAGLPSLERALGERNLRVENIAVYQDHTGGEMSGGAKQDAQSGSSPSPHRQVWPWDSPPQSSQAATGSAEDEDLASPATGLSIRA
jgi:flagellar hook-length control protein FliK